MWQGPRECAPELRPIYAPAARQSRASVTLQLGDAALCGLLEQEWQQSDAVHTGKLVGLGHAALKAVPKPKAGRARLVRSSRSAGMQLDRHCPKHFLLRFNVCSSQGAG